MKYHKINTIFARNEKGIINLQEMLEPFRYLTNCMWRGTEKIDGTNIRVYWNGETITFKGKTDKAEIPKHLQVALENLFDVETMKSVFGDTEVVLYGEGFGKKIQKVGSQYIKEDCSFILFDVMIDGLWLERFNVDNIAYQLKLESVPVVFEGTLYDAIDMVEKGFKSLISEDDDLLAEGLILTPIGDFLDRQGNRIITKIKHKDFVRYNRVKNEQD